MKGPHLQKLSDFPEKPPECGTANWGTHEIKDNRKQREQYEQATLQFLEHVTTRLSLMLPDSDLMSGFDLFNPMQQADRDACMLKLVDHFGQQRGDHKPVIVAEQTQHKWALAYNQLLKYKTMNEFFNGFICPLRDTYPNLYILGKIGLIIPITSVNCERAISRYNAIKTDVRVTLNVDNVNKLMMLSIEAPSYKTFNYEPAFEEWCMKTNRRLPF